MIYWTSSSGSRMVQSSLLFFIQIYYGITQFCLFGSIGIVTITAFDRFLTIKSSNLSTRRFRYHLYSVFILLFSGKKSSLYSSSNQEFSVLMTGPLFIKTQIIDYDNDASEIECKINWSSLRWIPLFIDRFVEMKKATWCWRQVSIAKMSFKSPTSLWPKKYQNNLAI